CTWCFPMAGCSPAPTRSPSSASCCRGNAGGRGDSPCPVCGRWRGGVTGGSPSGGAGRGGGSRGRAGPPKVALEEAVVTTETSLSDAVWTALRGVKDPELNLNIIDLGLVYEVDVEDGNVHIRMTLTSPGCPAGPQIMNDIHKTLRPMEGVKDV